MYLSRISTMRSLQLAENSFQALGLIVKASGGMERFTILCLLSTAWLWNVELTN